MFSGSEPPPAFDVLLTNPAYSADHVPRLLQFCASLHAPCLLLMPSYVYCRDYFRPHAKQYAFLTPPFRYKYQSPANTANAKGERRRSGSGSSGTVTSPYVTFWYLRMGDALLKALVAWWKGEEAPCAGCHLAITAADLPQRMRDALDPSRTPLSKAEKAFALKRRRSPDGRPLCTTCGQICGNCRHTKAQSRS